MVHGRPRAAGDHPGDRRRRAAAVAGGEPSIALKRGLPTFHFVAAPFRFAADERRPPAGRVAAVAGSVRRLSLAVLLGALALMAMILVAGTEINGARRWLHFGGYSLQPSEFAKPAFVVSRPG